LSLDRPGLQPPAFPSLPRQALEYEGVASISSVALRASTEGRSRGAVLLLEAGAGAGRGSCVSEEHVATCWFLSRERERERGFGVDGSE